MLVIPRVSQPDSCVQANSAVTTFVLPPLSGISATSPADKEIRQMTVIAWALRFTRRRSTIDTKKFEDQPG